MSYTRLSFAALALGASLSSPVHADAPHVSTDIAPVHSLVGMVMLGVGAPDLIVTPGASPHGYALRPSQARNLQQADLVVWIGPELTPWLAKPIATLAPEADQLELLEAPGTQVLPFRDADEGEEQGDHGKAGEQGEHDHDGVDPHAWLDPENARVWLGVIAEHLATVDPENGARYRANAAAGQVALAQVEADLVQVLAGMQGKPFVTLHDAYQYFEVRFGLESAGTVTLSDAADPGPAHLSQLRDRLAGQGVTCAFAEPQFDPGLLEAAIESRDIKVITLDPIGSQFEPGPGLYGNLLRDMGEVIAGCVE
ncbi:MAG: zinc transport system substrate-binding protein [Paracoccaceae bacterium]|jgi:zinc transport system substrate-binding protein